MFVVCGEALFDVFAVADTPTGLTLDARVGGSPFNVAVGLARMGQPVQLLTAISRGFLGERLLQALVTEGVDTSAIQRSDAPTTLSLVGVDTAGVPSYAFYGEGCADRLLTEDALDLIATSVAAFNLGSYAAVTGATAQTQRALVKRHRHRSLIAYDPNIRLNVEPTLAVWRDQIDWMLTHTHLLKVSEEDLALVYPSVRIDDFAIAALAQGVTWLIVTRGAQGAVAWSAHGRTEMQPVRVDVVDTVGAGDTFQTGLLTWLAEHDALAPATLARLPAAAMREALSFAARAAAITCSRRGADLPRRAELS